MELSHNIVIDSMKLRIPFNLCQVIDHALMDKFILVNERELNENGSIEIDEHYFKECSLWRVKNGCKIRFAVQHLTDANQQVKQYLVILINSKILGANYFKGISKKTIKQVYKEIQNFDVVKFDYGHFIEHSYLSDCDFKRDWKQKDHDKLYSSIITDLDRTKKSSLSLKGYRRFNKKTNKGIEFGDRKRATHQTPFFKIYSKKIELFNNSPEFYSAHGKEFEQITDFHDIIRAEFTLKNRKAFKNFLDCENSLKCVLDLKQNQLLKALQKIKAIHITDRFKPKTMKGYSPTDTVILNLLHIWQNIEDIDWHVVQRYALSGMEAREMKNAKSRMKKKLEKIWFDSIYFTEDSKHYKEQEEYILQGLRMIGYII